MENKYYGRIADDLLSLKLKAFGATYIVGPKWCGKTTTAEHVAKSVLKLQNVNERANTLLLAQFTPDVLLEGEQPRLIDEWQDAPTLWDAVRVYCDEHPGKGHFILTGSTSKKVETLHTGTGRISRLKMYPMSLFESHESNGTVSLADLFDGTEHLEKGCHSDLSVDQLIFACCRGGWPSSVLLDDKEAQLATARDYFEQIYEMDMFHIDNKKRSKTTMKAVLKSYARNISTLAKKTSLIEDVRGTSEITPPTFDDYVEVLENLYIIEDMNGWCPQIRSASAIRSGRKREFIDPSIAVSALGMSPEKLRLDLNTFGFIFECLCIRDLRVYSSKLNGELSYYHDNLGLEADAVLSLADDRYALIEFKLGSKQIEEGAKHLCQLEELIQKHNDEGKGIQYRIPDLKIVITGGEYGFRRPDGVYVIPIGCLRN